MASTVEILQYIAKQYSTYIGFAIIIIGLISNILNIAVFTQLSIFRGKPASFFLTTESIVNCFQVSIILTLRTLTYAFSYDPSFTSIVWCKLRPTIGQTCALMSMTTVCFAAIDQYLSTSYYPQLQRLSTIKLARRVILILFCFTLIHAIPFAIFHTINPPMGCSPNNKIFQIYLSFIHFSITIGLLPITVSSLFAILAYFNVRRITRQQIPVIRRRLDKQLTAMILVRVCLLTCTVLPFTAFQIYQFTAMTNSKTILQIAIEQLIGAITYSILSCNYSASFWVFLLSSTRFRGQVKYFLFKKLWRKCRSQVNSRNNPTRPNQISPASDAFSHKDRLSN